MRTKTLHCIRISAVFPLHRVYFCTMRTGAEFDKGCSQGLYLSLRHHNASPTPVTGVIGQLLPRPRPENHPPLPSLRRHIISHRGGCCYLLKPPAASSKPHLVHISQPFFFSPSPLSLNNRSRAPSTNPQLFWNPSAFGHFAQCKATDLQTEEKSECGNVPGSWIGRSPPSDLQMATPSTIAGSPKVFEATSKGC